MDEVLSPEDEIARQKFLAAIQPYLDENMRIDKRAKANIPGSEISIDLFEGSTPSRIKQYKIPFSRHAVIDEQIAKWKDEGS
ncbi:hypothetical protein HDU98_003591, partial [Podochytrium sp. JEL0797]